MRDLDFWFWDGFSDAHLIESVHYVFLWFGFSVRLNFYTRTLVPVFNGFRVAQVLCMSCVVFCGFALDFISYGVFCYGS